MPRDIERLAPAAGEYSIAHASVSFSWPVGVGAGQKGSGSTISPSGYQSKRAIMTQPASSTSYTNALVRHYTEQARANAKQGAPTAKASGLTPYFGPGITPRKSVFDSSQARSSLNLTPANGRVNYGVDRQRTLYVSDTRQTEIETWLTQNINDKDNDWLFPDDIGDERVAKAMTGNSLLERAVMLAAYFGCREHFQIEQSTASGGSEGTFNCGSISITYWCRSSLKKDISYANSKFITES